MSQQRPTEYVTLLFLAALGQRTLSEGSAADTKLDSAVRQEFQWLENKNSPLFRKAELILKRLQASGLLTEASIPLAIYMSAMQAETETKLTQKASTP